VTACEMESKSREGRGSPPPSLPAFVSGREKKGGTSFPSSRRRSYNKTIVFRASGARSNKGAQSSPSRYSSKQYFAAPDGARRCRSGRLGVPTIPRQRLSATTRRTHSRRLWIFDAVRERERERERERKRERSLPPRVDARETFAPASPS
jgi:hypothetical protein